MDHLMLQLLVFFFSSRRRHTRLQGDWSSDVCSSDLTAAELARFRRAQLAARAAELVALWDDRLEPRDDESLARLARRARERRAMGGDPPLFGGHTWGAGVRGSRPGSRPPGAPRRPKPRLPG